MTNRSVLLFYRQSLTWQRNIILLQFYSRWSRFQEQKLINAGQKKGIIRVASRARISETIRRSELRKGCLPQILEHHRSIPTFSGWYGRRRWNNVCHSNTPSLPTRTGYGSLSHQPPCEKADKRFL